ncbi:MAG: MFS transporter [Thioalkalivibrionaceae bacterium]
MAAVNDSPSPAAGHSGDESSGSDPSGETPKTATGRAVWETYALLTGDEDARVCKDIPEAACRAQPKNYVIHLVTNTLTKIGDELASARIVLAWLLGALGAPAAFAGFLVPIRESGSLLPQLLIAAQIRAREIRKGFWILGAFGQGAAVAGMAVVALTLEGTAAGFAILALLVVFSLSRGVSSVAAKDVLGKTVAKTQRGGVMGYAAAAAGVVTLGVGVFFFLYDPSNGGIAVFAALLAIAAGLWFLAGTLFWRLEEQPGATEGGANALAEALAQLRLLRDDRPFAHFVLTRALLMSTALALPYYVLLAEEVSSGDFVTLGLLIIATGLAQSLSSPFWGRFSDRSSRIVLMLSGALATLVGAVTVALVWTLGVDALAGWVFAVLFFVLGVAHAGVRLGRKTYLVDLGDETNRAAYTAVSNSVIGVLLLVGGFFGLVAQLAGTEVAILALAVLSGAGVVSAARMQEAE